MYLSYMFVRGEMLFLLVSSWRCINGVLSLCESQRPFGHYLYVLTASFSLPSSRAGARFLSGALCVADLQRAGRRNIVVIYSAASSVPCIRVVTRRETRKYANIHRLLIITAATGPRALAYPSARV